MAVGQWIGTDEKQQKEWLRSGIVPADYPGPVAADYSDLLEIIEEKVKPERTRKNDEGEYQLRYPLYLKWWIYGDKRPDLYSSIQKLEKILVAARVSKSLIFTWVESGLVFSEMLVVLAVTDHAFLSILQSSIHQAFAWEHCSTMRDAGIRYSPTDATETFAFPYAISHYEFMPSEAKHFSALEKTGERYYQHRQTIMQTRQEGLTKTYNRFHNPAETSPDIAELRRLHVAMDEAVATAYGWQDLALNHGFHETKQGIRYTISEAARREVLDRLLELNHQRHAEEVAAGLHDKKTGKSAAPRQPQSAPSGTLPQVDMFGHAQADVFDTPDAGREAGSEGREKLALPHPAPRISPPGSSLLDYLQAHPGWHSKDALLTSTGFPAHRWNAEIKRLQDSGQVEREGDKRGAKYRFRGA
jgi:hypothetical protein